MTAPKVTARGILVSFVGAFLAVATAAGFDWKDWNPANPHDLMRVVPIALVALVATFAGVNTQDASSKAFIADGLSLFQSIIDHAAKNPGSIPPEIVSKAQAKIDAARPEELNHAASDPWSKWPQDAAQKPAGKP